VPEQHVSLKTHQIARVHRYWNFRSSRTWDRQQKPGSNASSSSPGFASQPESKEQLQGQMSGETGSWEPNPASSLCNCISRIRNDTPLAQESLM
jgi:hypothetical protein